MGKVHKSYYANSDTYKSLYDKYGAVLNLVQAEHLAKMHGTTLGELEYPATQRLFGTLELVQRLGY